MFLWNTIGSICSAGSSFVLLVFVTRICGSSDAGVFALGFANAQLMLTIGRFGMRAYQATDIKFRVKFQTYFMSRILTSMAMLVVSGGYLLWHGYSFEKSAILFCICVIKLADALEDVFHGLFQQNGRMDLAGKLLTLRNVVTILSFTGILVITKDLLLTCAVTALLSVAASIFMNLPKARTFENLRFACSKEELGILIKSCFPLFIGSFLSLYIYNVPKYMIDRFLSSDIQTFFSILFMPTFVINLLSEFLFKPLLTNIAVQWEQSEVRLFVQYIGRLLLGIIAITLITITAGAFFGCEVLSFIYGVNLLPFRTELILLLCGGGFGAGVFLLLHILTAMRKQVGLLYGYMMVSLIITFLTPALTKEYHMMGASIASVISSILLFILFSLMLLLGILRKSKTL